MDRKYLAVGVLSLAYDFRGQAFPAHKSLCRVAVRHVRGCSLFPPEKAHYYILGQVVEEDGVQCPSYAVEAHLVYML